MLGLRQRLSLGFGALLLVIVGISVQSVLHLKRLGESIDVILRENYRSVIACQEMKEALERMDSGLLFTLLESRDMGNDLIRDNLTAFEKSLGVELNNITVSGEGEKARHIQDLFVKCKAALENVRNPSLSVESRRSFYYSQWYPLFLQTKKTADEILVLNQNNMTGANAQTRASATAAQREMYLLSFAGIFVAAGFVLFTRKWILRPINRLIRSTEDIRKGNLEFVVSIDTRDEIGRLSEAFNEMTASLREFRRSDHAKWVRIQQATQQAFDSLPEAVALLDLDGRVEVATETARKVFGIKPAARIQLLHFDWLADLFNRALVSRIAVQLKGSQKIIQQFVDGKERYFRPQAIPILDENRQPAGIVLVFQDVTLQRQDEEVKKGLISTVSHQLKTPLTSIRMAVHLLLGKKVGPLNDKQEELLATAREDSDRLHGIIDSLLDISRIESGKAKMEFQPVSVGSLMAESVETFRRTAQEKGIVLDVRLSEGLPDVWADKSRIEHVFDNLLSNALKHTPAGGRITVSAEVREIWVFFSVSDTGKGIPKEYLSRIFDPFFRVPDQDGMAGAGLGLAIVREIVDAHGGSVDAVSGEGKGSTFTFSIRRADVARLEEKI